MKFRPQRGSIEKAMKEVKEIKSLIDFYNIAKEEKFDIEKYLHEISFTYLGFDKRINWDTYLVSVNGHGIGFSDGEIKL
jgi:hypothetical protein